MRAYQSNANICFTSTRGESFALPQKMSNKRCLFIYPTFNLNNPGHKTAIEFVETQIPSESEVLTQLQHFQARNRKIC